MVQSDNSVIENSTNFDCTIVLFSFIFQFKLYLVNFQATGMVDTIWDFIKQGDSNAVGFK